MAVITSVDYISLNMNFLNLNLKTYDLRVVGLISIQNNFYSANGTNLLPKEKIHSMLKNDLMLSKYKCKSRIDTLLKNGMLKIYEDKYYIFNSVAQPPFLKMSYSTFWYCIENKVSEESFKIYCYLLNKYNLKNADSKYFSKYELYTMMGYAHNQNSAVLIENALLELEEKDLLSYNHEYTSRARMHGVYYELYEVKVKDC